MEDKFTTRVAVFVVVRSKAGELLLQQRANTGYLDGYWDFAASGHLEAGESIRAAAIRELSEEIGLTAKEEDLKLVHVGQNHLDIPYINFIFMLDTWQGEPAIQEPDKCTGLEWFALNALPQHCTLGVRVKHRSGLDDELTYTYVNTENYEAYMNEKWPGESRS